MSLVKLPGRQAPTSYRGGCRPDPGALETAYLEKKAGL